MFDITPHLQCIENVAPSTVVQIIQKESGDRRFAINVNKPKGKKTPHYSQPTNKNAAIQAAKYWTNKGYSVDLGLMQINSKNLKHYGANLTTIFDTCTNLRIGSQILFDGYQRAIKTTSNPQFALQKALSIYNTGNMSYGFRNGYVAKYTHNPLTLAANVSSKSSNPNFQPTTLTFNLYHH